MLVLVSEVGVVEELGELDGVEVTWPVVVDETEVLVPVMVSEVVERISDVVVAKSEVVVEKSEVVVEKSEVVVSVMGGTPPDIVSVVVLVWALTTLKQRNNKSTKKYPTEETGIAVSASKYNLAFAKRRRSND